ncbi:hypothetical protein C8J55DRAFT_155658 [Lentinula edodes]|uniref:Secreted protein n=1 Tax=Lentinula lateritia TaxID=40482 RepID=A0A9W9DJ99_9AGAR|nr:hypothetical protein C8J55DRAFT_155658 [Lentinula edodes]
MRFCLGLVLAMVCSFLIVMAAPVDVRSCYCHVTTRINDHLFCSTPKVNAENAYAPALIRFPWGVTHSEEPHVPEEVFQRVVRYLNDIKTANSSLPLPVIDSLEHAHKQVAFYGGSAWPAGHSVKAEFKFGWFNVHEKSVTWVTLPAGSPRYEVEA